MMRLPQRFFSPLAMVFGSAVLLSGCGAASLFSNYDEPEGPQVATAVYPRLIDVPVPPPGDDAVAGYPSPAAGDAIARDLDALARKMAARDAALRAEPLLDDRFWARARAARARAKRPLPQL